MFSKQKYPVIYLDIIGIYSAMARCLWTPSLFRFPIPPPQVWAFILSCPPWFFGNIGCGCGGSFLGNVQD